MYLENLDDILLCPSMCPLLITTANRKKKQSVLIFITFNCPCFLKSYSTLNCAWDYIILLILGTGQITHLKVLDHKACLMHA